MTEHDFAKQANAYPAMMVSATYMGHLCAWVVPCTHVMYWFAGEVTILPNRSWAFLAPGEHGIGRFEDFEEALVAYLLINGSPV